MPVPVLISIRPSEIDTPPLLPSPSRLTTPEPFGKISMSLFEAETISNVTTSRLPPSSGEESADTAVSPPAELIRLFTVTLLRTPASASLSSNSSFAGVTSPEVIVVLPVITVLSVSSCRNTVPLAFGKFIVLSAVGSITPSVVSLSSAVEPSKINCRFVATVENDTVPDSSPRTSDCRLLNSCLNCSRLLLVVTCDAVIAISFYPVKFLKYLLFSAFHISKYLSHELHF